MLHLLLVLAASAADCPEPVSSAALAQRVASADAAFAAMDLDAFRAAADAVRASIDCLSDPITPFDAAGVHRTRALSAFVDEDEPTARGAFRSLLAAAPDYELPERLAPPGTPLRTLFDQAREDGPGPVDPLVPPVGTLLMMDGLRSVDRPVERPVVLQALTDRGAVSRSDWLPPSRPAPDWAHAPPPPEPPEPVRERRGATLPLLVVSGASAALAGGAYGYAWVQRGRFDDLETPMEDLAGLQGRTNGAVIVSASLLGVGLGTGLGAVLAR